MSDIDQDFADFHRKRPEVYAYLRHVSLQFVRKGHKWLSIKFIYEYARADAYLTGRATKMWELSNNFTSRYSRLLMAQEPELRGIFRTRPLKGEPHGHSRESVEEPYELSQDELDAMGLH